jgi:hypothetical protein
LSKRESILFGRNVYHDDFKIIIDGREIPYPASKICTIWGIAFVLGMLLGRFL